jgi:acetylornithine deacetylase/succinyl-diaminopimelate desuccinylase-like protein
MKGGIASLLSALPRTGRTNGLYLVFDVDEEYYFKGIDKFVESNRVNPAIAVFPEPGFRVSNGHRGVIEIEITVGGTTAHSSVPNKGKNAG